MALSDAKVKNATKGDKQKKLYDTDGMYLLVTPAGGKCWRLKYRFDGKEKVLALGRYPEITLEDARGKRADARKLLANGVDPNESKKAQKASKAESSANSFEVVAREWHGKFSPRWSESHAEKINNRLELDIYPWIGSRPISEMKAPELLAVLRRVESRGALDTAHRIRSTCGQIFRYAISTGRADRDIAADLKGALPPVEKRHMAAIVDPNEIAPLLRMLDGYSGTFVVKCALRLAPLLMLRPGELRKTEWSEVDFENALLKIPVARMKLPKSEKQMNKKGLHYVPLASQSVKILSELKFLTGNSSYVFPSGRSYQRPMSDNTVNAALRRMGIDTKEEITGHGFRAMARTVLDEGLNVKEKYLELQLGHAVKSPNGRAYDRTSFLPERIQMMQQWADYLDELKASNQ